MQHRILYSLLVLGVLIPSVLSGQENTGVRADMRITYSRDIGDQNRIQHVMSGTYLQDLSGRTAVRLNEFTMISDPVKGLAWQVDHSNGVAVEVSLKAPSLDGNVSGLESKSTIGNWESEPEFPAVPQGVAQDMSVVDLGTTIVEGIERAGRRWTGYIPVGELGNVNPVKIEAEMWVADVFGVELPVRTTTKDPINGEQTRELHGFRRTDLEYTHFKPGPEIQVRRVFEDLNSKDPE